MKSKTITQLVLLSLLCLVTIPTIQAAKPLGKIVEIEHIDETVGDEHWVGILKTTMIIWDIEEDLQRVTVTGIHVARLYKASTGKLAAKIKFSMTYTGTMYDLNDWCTGTYVMSWVAIPVADELIPEEDYDTNGLVLMKYKNGKSVWSKERGVMWWLFNGG